MEKKFTNTLNNLLDRRNSLELEIERTFQDVAKAFMEKYQTNQIEFDLDSGVFPTLSICQNDDDNADCDVRKIAFNENGQILTIDGYTHYNDDDVYDVPFYEFYNVDFLDLAHYLNYQIIHGQYVEE